jgi:hypothetical protein
MHRLVTMAAKELHVKAEILGLKIGWIARMCLQRRWLKIPIWYIYL